MTETLIERVQLVIEAEWVQVTREEAASIFARAVQPEPGWQTLLCQEYLFEEVVSLPGRVGQDYLLSYLTWTVVLWRFDREEMKVAWREVRVGWDEGEANFFEITPRSSYNKEVSLGRGGTHRFHA